MGEILCLLVHSSNGCWVWGQTTRSQELHLGFLVGGRTPVVRADSVLMNWNVLQIGAQTHSAEVSTLPVL